MRFGPASVRLLRIISSALAAHPFLVVFLGFCAFAGLAFTDAAPARARFDAQDAATDIMPTVRGPVPDGVARSPVFELENLRLARLGYVDVTAPPFFADPTGRRDSTLALQRAVTFARDHQMVCFFPSGKYLISDTLDCIQPLYKRSNGQLLNARHHPCVLAGSRKGVRPKIVLATHAPGFGDPRHPKYVIHFWARDARDPQKPLPGDSMNQMFVNIDVTIGPGNPGAVGIRHRAAQGSGIQDCVVDAGSGLTGIEGGIGSGGSYVNVTVLGGETGLDMRETEPSSTITGVTLIGQRRRALFYAGRQSLTAVGLRIRTRTGPAIETRSVNWGPDQGQMNLVDARVECETPQGSAIRAGSSLYLENVWVQGCEWVVEEADGPGKREGRRKPGGFSLAARPSGWTHVQRLALPVTQKKWKEYQYTAPVYRDGVAASAPLVRLGDPGSEALAVPEDLVSRHLWPRGVPCFQTKGAATVTQSPYKAVGDGKADDADAIQRAIDESEVVFLPKGYYALSRPLRLKPWTKLVGVAGNFSLLMPQPGAEMFTDPANPRPLIASSNDPEGTQMLAFLGMYVPPAFAGGYGILWRGGPSSILREVQVITSPPLGGYANPGKPPDRSCPLVIVDGGAGKWYNLFLDSYFHQTPAYRHLLIRDTRGPFSVYQCNTEHARGDANTEIVNSSGVRLYGLKGEGNRPIVRVRDSRDVRLIGYGGNAAGYEGRALFEIFSSDDVVLANLVDAPRLAGRGSDTFYAGRGVDPLQWHMISVRGVEGVTGTGPLERPTLFVIGPGKTPAH